MIKTCIVPVQITGMVFMACVLFAGTLLGEEVPPRDISSEQTREDPNSSAGSFPDMIQGDWVLLLHYPTKTQMVDITIHPSTMVTSRNTDVCADMSISHSEHDSLIMANDQIRIEAVLDPEAVRLRGIAIVQGIRGPVPCSAFKIIPDREQE